MKFRFIVACSLLLAMAGCGGTGGTPTQTSVVITVATAATTTAASRPENPPLSGRPTQAPIQTRGLDPYPRDTDNDALDNDVDPDDDGDGVPDTVDNCLLLRNPNQTDFDGDGTGDGCDLDADGDTVHNQLEEIAGSDPYDPLSRPEFLGVDKELGPLRAACTDKVDNDLDGEVDGSDSGCIDPDLDTAPDLVDNCPRTPNPGWIDTDHDGLGDACDPTPRPRNDPPTGVSAGGPYTVSEGGTITVTATGVDPDNDPIVFAWDTDGEGSIETPGQTAAVDAKYFDGDSIQTITVQVVDSIGQTATAQATLNVLNVAPSLAAIKAQPDTILRSSPVTATITFTDAGIFDSHIATWEWGDSDTSSGIINEVFGEGTVTGTHTYAAAGTYTVTVTVTDDDGGTTKGTTRLEVDN